ncbi:MAG TPA: prepilin-type N-terminal cleavage/methylation domain-containing protein [Candidatus Sumerlaeota bacterium]|nr:prepilin-type N-terminal cleavage/methylation domain-containing protein [Candidatus Sumerlaeota bacterium]
MAFTLIELLIVVAILAVLAAIAVPNFLEAQTRSKISRVKADLRVVSTALQMYWTDNGGYPPGLMEKKSMGKYNWEAAGLYVDDANLSNNWELKALTTPVAYLAACLPDIFKVGKTSDLENDTNYEYQNNQVRYAYMQEKGYTGQAPFLWELRSNGPDQVRTTGASPENYVLQVYDSTNGTRSDGDILWIDRGLVEDAGTGRTGK